MIKGTLEFENILGEGTGPDWKIHRYPFLDSPTGTVDLMKEGYLVKFSASGAEVMAASQADDNSLIGVIVGLPVPEEDKGPSGYLTVAVALEGTFDFNQVHYGDAWQTVPPVPPPPISAAGMDRLAKLNIFLDPAIPAVP
jgi:hypothetical protein